MSNSGIVGLYVSSIFSCLFFFLRNFHAVLHSGYMNLHSHQQCKKIHFSPYSLEHKFFADFSMMAILIDERWYFIVTLIWISLMIFKGFQGGSVVKNPPAMQETRVQSLYQEDPLEKEMATHSSIIAWRVPMNRGALGAIVHGVAKSGHD